MSRKIKKLNSQLTNLTTLASIRRQMFLIAENRIRYFGIPNSVDITYVNKILLANGSIACFIDDVLGFLMLPYKLAGKMDCYNNPTAIQCYSANGYVSRILRKNEYVILWDNTSKISIAPDIEILAQRMSIASRTMDINISQQKTPRFFKTSTENVQTVKNVINDVDTYENLVLTYDDFAIDDITTILAPSPYVSDKLYDYYDRLWAEFLRLIGMNSITSTKKERLLTDEIRYSQGGALLSRESYLVTRELWVAELKQKFDNIQIDFEYADLEKE